MLFSNKRATAGQHLLHRYYNDASVDFLCSLISLLFPVANGSFDNTTDTCSDTSLLQYLAGGSVSATGLIPEHPSPFLTRSWRSISHPRLLCQLAVCLFGGSVSCSFRSTWLCSPCSPWSPLFSKKLPAATWAVTISRRSGKDSSLVHQAIRVFRCAPPLPQIRESSGRSPPTPNSCKPRSSSCHCGSAGPLRVRLQSLPVCVRHVDPQPHPRQELFLYYRQHDPTRRV